MRKQKREYFAITNVSRHDLTAIGFDVRRVDDETMERLAAKMAEAAYVADDFWRNLRNTADAFGIPKSGEGD